MAKKKDIQEVKKEKKEVVFITKELKQSKISNEEFDKVKGFLILVVIIGIFVSVLFLVNGNLVTKDLKEEETTTTTTTEAEYDSKLLTADSVFNVKDKNYYVLFYDASNADEKTYAEEFINKYKDDKTPLYKVNLGDLMNKKYYDKNGTENIKPTSKEDLLITRTTLIKFKKNKAVSFITDKNEIAKTLTPEEEK